MALTDVIAQIDSEISILQQARALLSGSNGAPAEKKAGRGRPKGSKNAVAEAAPQAETTGKRKLSPEGRKAIAEAMKRRWAERRKQPAK